MTTIINTPPASTEGSATGMIVGIIIGALIVILLIIFGVRYYRGQAYAAPSAPASQAAVTVPGAGTTVNVTAPTAPAPAAPASSPSGTTNSGY